MKKETEKKINEIARLIWNRRFPGLSLKAPCDFREFEPDFWDMALIAYVECFPKHRNLLKWRTKK